LRFVLVIGLLLFWAGRGRADVEPIRISYSAPSRCPSFDEFQRQVFERTSSARLAKPGEDARLFEVRIERGRDGLVVGRFVIREENGATVARQVSGTACSEVALVLALASALAIDPRAELAPRQKLERVVHDEPVQDEEPHAPIDLFALMEPVWEVSPSLGLRAATGMGPRPTLGGALAIAGRPLASQWSFGVEVDYLKSLTQSVRGASADFRFILLRPNFCPLAAVLGDVLRVSACAVAELGLVTASGTDIDHPESSDSLWAAGELMLRLEAPVERRWFLSADAGVLVPLTRYRFTFDNPQVPVHEVPLAMFTGRLGLGVRF